MEQSPMAPRPVDDHANGREGADAAEPDRAHGAGVGVQVGQQRPEGGECGKRGDGGRGKDAGNGSHQPEGGDAKQGMGTAHHSASFPGFLEGAKRTVTVTSPGPEMAVSVPSGNGRGGWRAASGPSGQPAFSSASISAKMSRGDAPGSLRGAGGKEAA